MKRDKLNLIWKCEYHHDLTSIVWLGSLKRLGDKLLISDSKYSIALHYTLHQLQIIPNLVASKNANLVFHRFGG